MSTRIMIGDCIEVCNGLESDSHAACVTDPPYHLSEIPHVPSGGFGGARPERKRVARSGFMGKTWDGGDVAFRPETWSAVYRVLKPGAHLAAFGGTRTYHRMVCAIEDAGFEIRDQLAWVYASGFPKSLDVSKAIDRAAGAERKIVGFVRAGIGRNCRHGGEIVGGVADETEKWIETTAPATEAAQQWQGWGTALKPAWEPIVLARKPLSEGTVAANVLRWGTGALNIDAGRIGTTRDVPSSKSAKRAMEGWGMREQPDACFDPNVGRWPANLAHDGSPGVMEAFARFGESKSTGGQASLGAFRNGKVYGSGRDEREARDPGLGYTGTAARFFFCGKAQSWEREGNHPTVKPLALMEWLVKLVTPPNSGPVLDPFCGTGSTLVACDHLGFAATGIELDPKTCADAEHKIKRLRARRMLGADAKHVAPLSGQMGLFA